MRLMGWCRACHRFRTVRVERWTATNLPPTGICDECQDAEDSV